MVDRSLKALHMTRISFFGIVGFMLSLAWDYLIPQVMMM